MTQDDLDLPDHTTLRTIPDVPRAGNIAEQVRWNDQAWAMLETFTHPTGFKGTRLANAWLGLHDWQVCVVLRSWVQDEEWMQPFTAAALQVEAKSLIGLTVDPAFATPSAVWRLPAMADPVSRFFQSQFTTSHLLFPEDRSFAIHADDGAYAIYAGPEAFLRAALPEHAIGQEATRASIAEIEAAGATPEYMDSIMRHYEPFLLDADEAG